MTSSQHLYTTAQIIFPIPIDTSFTYHIPEHLRASIQIGQRVHAPFGPHDTIGFVHKLLDTAKDTRTLKDIVKIIDENPVLNDEQWNLAQWMSTYYACSFGEALWQLVPKKSSVRILKKSAGLLEQGTLPTKSFFTLTQDQRRAYNAIADAIRNQQQNNFLLYGVPGSGKTEVYLHAMRDVLSQGKQVVYLIPEIALTPQTVERLVERFGSDVAVLHSQMTDRERFLAWKKILNNEVHIVAGPRSAVLAPFTNIGLFVIDEEQEDSYKQDQKPQYDARTVVMWRARYHNAVVIIGSATPRVETMYLIEHGHYTCLRLPKKIYEQETNETSIVSSNHTEPTMRVVDMRKELERKNFSVLSSPLKQEIAARLSRHEQTILFLNRRGFDTFVFCRTCGHVMQCPHCDISLVYHRDTEKLLCHYCGFHTENPTICPACASSAIKHFGAGIQKVETEVLNLFPQARVARLDQDAAHKKGYLEQVYTAFHRHEIDILMGTQLVAKGLDFPYVTLVGIISADTALNLPDFRASERTFSLLVQAAGRSGRREGASDVILQTYYPQHYAITTAAHNDYDAFYKEELEWRKKLGYPPFTHLVNITFRGKTNDAVRVEAEYVAQHLAKSTASSSEATNIEIIGPFQALVPKRYGNHRWQIVIKEKRIYKSYDDPHPWLAFFRTYRPQRGIRIAIDVDPVQMM